MQTLIKGGTIVNEGQQKRADIIIENDLIKEIIPEGISANDADSFACIIKDYDRVVDATGCLVMPGVIDTHVHFREPGLTHKADMETESRAAAFGGVTTVLDMPNTKPQTTTMEALREKEEIAKGKMHVNYAFFPGATNDNSDELAKLDIHRIPGIKLFMGSSTGNMLVDKELALETVFRLAKEMNLPLMAHCEDTDIINANMAECKKNCATDDPEVIHHPEIRSAEACCRSSSLAKKLADKHGTSLHIAHISTSTELPLLGGNVTGEATVAHLLFSQEDYRRLGARIKCNPAIKSAADREALRAAIRSNGAITTIATDHAPHTIEEKQGGAAKAMSGMPMLQFSLVAMLSLVDEGVTSIERLVELMCHNPSKLFSIVSRGYLREGYKADIAIVKCQETPWTVTKESIQSKCGWSPLEGMAFRWKVCQTLVNGQLVYDTTKEATPDGGFDSRILGEHATFRHQ